MSNPLSKIKKHLIRLLWKPIPVLCFHEIGNFCEGSPDWVPTSFLKKKIEEMLNEGYTFVTLSEVHRHLCKDKFRIKKIAALTADDGLKCQQEIFPWLKERNIPITLFCNVTSVKQEKCGLPYEKWFKFETKEQELKMAAEMYMSKNELEEGLPDNVSIGSHGYAHDEAVTSMSLAEFEKDVDGCVEMFSQHKCYTAFYAYPYGKHSEMTDKMLKDKNIVPVYMDDRENYIDGRTIHRVSIERMYKDERN